VKATIGVIDPLLRRCAPRWSARADCDRLALVLKGKKLGFTLVEIGRMVAAEEGRASSQSLRFSREKCLEQIAVLEKQQQELEEAIAELRRIHSMLAGKAGNVKE
jgi:DNA-binding transcriptional MerR regulator